MGGEGCKSVLDTEGNCPQFGGSRSWIWLPGERNHMYSLYDVQCIQMNMYSLYNVRCIQMNMHSQYTDEMYIKILDQAPMGRNHLALSAVQ